MNVKVGENFGELIESVTEYIPEIGDMVLFHTQQFDRPAVITHVFTEQCVNLFVFPDGTYDPGLEFPLKKTSVLKGEQVGQWSARPFEFLETIQVAEE